MKFLILQTLFLTFLSKEVLSVNQLTIIKNEMSEVMKEFSIGTALVALSESSDKNIMADKLANALNSKYGPQWNSLVGPIGVVSHFKTQPNTLLNFKYGDTQIFLFKLQSNPTHTNESKDEYMDIISHARKIVSPVIEYQYGLNSTKPVEIISAAKEAVNYDPKDLNCSPNYLVPTHNCFFGLAVKLQDILKYKLKGKWRVSVGVLNDYESVVSKYLNYYSFRLANLHFKVNEVLGN